MNSLVKLLAAAGTATFVAGAALAQSTTAELPKQHEQS